MKKTETKKVTDAEMARLIRKERAKSGPDGLNPVFRQYARITMFLELYLGNRGYSTSRDRPW